MPNTTLDWWRDTYNELAATVSNAQTVTTATTNPAHTRVEIVHRPTASARLAVAAHHIAHATDTPRGRFVCAYAAHRAAWTETHGEDRSTKLWKALATLSALAALVAVAALLAGDYGAILLVACVVCLVAAFAAIPVARWSLAGKRDAFHHCTRHAVETAGAEAARDYIDHAAFQHRTIIHNIDAGLPQTPKRIYRAIGNAIEMETARA